MSDTESPTRVTCPNVETCQAHFEEITRKLDKIERLLTGGTTPGDGLIVRVDRLEQSEASRRGYVALVWTAILGVIAQVLWTLLAKK